MTRSNVPGARTIAITIGTISVLVTGCVGGSAPESSAPSGSPTPPEPTPSVVEQVARAVGISGGVVWSTSSNSLSVLADSGEWSSIALPEGLATGAVAAVARDANGSINLASLAPDGVQFFRQTGGSWQRSVLTPTWPDIVRQYGDPDIAAIEPSPDGSISVSTTIRVGRTSAFSDLFISTDSGSTFTEHPAEVASDTDTLWRSLVTTSSGGRVLVAGPTSHLLFSASDDATWSPIDVASLVGSSTFELGPVSVSDSSTFGVPVTLETDSGGSLIVLTSADGGKTFGSGSATPLSLPSYRPPTTSASLGTVTWVISPDGGHLFESADAGRSWSTVDPTGLPGDVTDMALTSPSSAIVLSQTTSCDSDKTNCRDATELARTTDGGQTWQGVDLPQP